MLIQSQWRYWLGLWMGSNLQNFHPDPAGPENLTDSSESGLLLPKTPNEEMTQLGKIWIPMGFLKVILTVPSGRLSNILSDV